MAAKVLPGPKLPGRDRTAARRDHGSNVSGHSDFCGIYSIPCKETAPEIPSRR
jgi:hypothetical protein